MSQTAKPIFANFMQIEPIIPRWLWHVLRTLSLIVFVFTIWGAWHFPEITLIIFWGIAVPLLPIVFWLLPGLWRNLCPLAAANQIPRLFNFSLAKEVPAKLKRYASVIGLTLLFIAIPLRKIALNDNADILSFVLIGIIGFAFFGGLLFKGKSGWCGSFCPLLPVQRLYGQSPLAIVNNSHCSPCVGCTKNCFDFNPQVAYLADLYDSDPILAGDRKFFAGMMPGLLLAYFYMPYTPEIPVYQLYLQFGLYCLIGVGAYQVIETLFKLSPQKNTALFAVISINIFYWYASVILFESIGKLSGFAFPDWSAWSIRGAVALISIFWFWKTLAKEKMFLSQAFASSAQTKVASMRHLTKHGAKQTDNPTITIQPGNEQLVAKAEMTLLDLLEANGHNINSGCRMGACGADPVAIVKGEENLNEKSGEETATLERLGYKKGVRMACCVKATSSVTINLDPESVEQEEDESEVAQDDNIHSVVIIGNGIAGVTAADYIRRHHKNCEIHLIGAEKYPLYNRMAISKLIYGRTALQSLILMPDEWYKKRDIQQWLNTQVESIDPTKKVVTLATRESINYDKLIITTGSNARIPAIKNWATQGCFTLRTAEDGMSIRTFLQDHQCKRVIIAGGGLLGLEAAYAFTQVGMRVTVLERSKYLLRRQLDEKSANLLHAYLSALGITIIYQAEVDEVIGNEMLEAIKLKTGEKILANLLLVAAGIVANQKLTKDDILKTNKGILVDDHLQTSQRDIYAAGDIAELDGSNGKLPGLWPIAVDQGRIAAINALGGDQVYVDKPVATGLKVVGVELTSMGTFIGEKEDSEIIFKTKDRYRKLVIRDQKIIGCILLGYPEFSGQIANYINQKKTLTESDIKALRENDWHLFI
ncbi:FAD-dependent oxidoreductase [Aliikangiella coralliicola]|uniref:2Fe-2S iron-sulfur cluster binding domain-containing protein n=1 Tax=Aliikangiella coralliicola TaxID=2592383 RepID=A0A545U6B5_9GAMM|nr:FAD-dependent oxidoreductase [Aliikangiella coralliicola]TQV85012.1 2Fe-2S iron-sulfur cluster binding domain-containing protein [Aliikangiella coralliicola]